MLDGTNLQHGILNNRRYTQPKNIIADILRKQDLQLQVCFDSKAYACESMEPANLVYQEPLSQEDEL